MTTRIAIACICLSTSAHADQPGATTAPAALQVATAAADSVAVTDDAEPVPPARSAYEVNVMTGFQLAPLAADDVLGRIAIGGARRWNRWQIGARVVLATGAVVSFVDEEQVEAGMWLHASPRLDVLLAWRVGRAGFHFSAAFENAVVFDPVVELAVRMSPKVDLQITPLAVSLYRAGIWQVSFGPDIGLAWRL